MAIAISSAGDSITLADIKARLNKSNVMVDDREIKAMLEAALAEYEQYVGPVGGTFTETHDGGDTSIRLRNRQAETLTSVMYADGTEISIEDLVLDTTTGIIYWAYGTAGRFVSGPRNVTVNYTVSGPPPNHRETIIADVAGYFAATQRGPAGLPGEGYEAAYTATPTVLFPRIRALAGPRIA